MTLLAGLTCGITKMAVQDEQASRAILASGDKQGAREMLRTAEAEKIAFADLDALEQLANSK